MKTILDSTAISKIEKQSDMDEFVSSLGLKSETVLLKPNWVDVSLGSHTEAKILDQFLTSLKGKKIYLVESYTFWRTEKSTLGQGDYFSSKEAYFETGKQHWDHFREQDQWFLNYTGIGEVLKKHHTTYLNITSELWQENTTNLVPKKIKDLHGADFISLAKLKGDSEFGATLSIKNFFGLYPDPHRKKYHGEDDTKLLQSILEINKTYRQLFNCFFVVEGIFTASHVDWGSKGLQSFKDFGVIVGGKDGYQVDSYAFKLINRQPLGQLKNLLSDYQKIFGGTFTNQEIPFDYHIEFPPL
ncbi:MAG: DUF362 domain-containing protein [Candidatus Shapirobacteria bacterium]|jgi:hypothetical protein